MKKIRLRIILAIGILVVLFSSIQFYSTYYRIQQSLDHLHRHQLDIALGFDLSIREYIAEVLRPAIREYFPEDAFIPEIMSSSYASRIIFEKFRSRFPGLVIKFSADNPRNPVNQGGASELDTINFFNAHPELDEWTDEISLAGMPHLAKFKPMRMQQQCLACHGDPADAPAGLVARYGDTASFHLPMGRVVGMDMVAIPSGADTAAIMGETIRNFSFLFAGILCLFFSIVLVLRLMINDRKIAARALAESENEKQIILDSISDAVFYFGSPKLNLIWVNREALAITGMSAEELFKTTCYRYMGKEKPCNGCPVLKTFESGNPAEAEISTPDGRWWQVRSFPAMDTAHGLKGVVKVASDITARRIAEKMVEESRERYRLIFNQAPVGIFHYDRNGVITDCNQQFIAMMESSRVKLINLNMLDKIEDEVILQHIRASLAGEKSHYEGWYASVTGGRKLFLNADYVPVLDAEGRVSGGIGVNADLTERVMAEQAVRESEEKYRLLAETSSDGIYEIDLNGRFTYMSSGSEHIFGYSNQEVFGDHFKDYFTDAEMAAAFRLFERVIAGERIKSNHLDVRAKDGHLVHVDVSAAPIIRNGCVTGIHAIGRDITERIRIQKELAASEEKARTLLDAAIDAVVLLDRRGLILDLNTTCAARFGKSKTQMIGLCVWDLFPPENKTERKANVEKVFASGEPVNMVDLREGIWNYTNIFSIRDACGKVTRVAVFAHDFTELKAAEEAITAAKERMQNLSRHLQSAREHERKGIAREIHDELGQALTAIKLEAAWLVRNMGCDPYLLKSKAGGMASLADGAIQSVKRIITKLRPALLSDLGLAEAVRWQADALQGQSGIAFQIAIEQEILDCGDDLSTAIFRIFQEAATNAVRHSMASQIRVSLKLTVDRIELEVADNGIGIFDDQQEKENSFGILGMKERAYAFGGEIEISGNPGKGTRVRALFPVCITAVHQSARQTLLD